MNNYTGSFLSIRTYEMDDIIHQPELMEMARTLTIGPYSGINRALDYYTDLARIQHVNAIGIFAYYTDNPVGWILLTQESDSVAFRPQDDHVCAQIFVARDYRRHGIGTRLLQIASKRAQDKLVRVYDLDNIDFFSPLLQLLPNIKSIYSL